MYLSYRLANNTFTNAGDYIIYWNDSISRFVLYGWSYEPNIKYIEPLLYLGKEWSQSITVTDNITALGRTYHYNITSKGVVKGLINMNVEGAGNIPVWEIIVNIPQGVYTMQQIEMFISDSYPLPLRKIITYYEGSRKTRSIIYELFSPPLKLSQV